MSKFDEALKTLSPVEKRAILKGLQGQKGKAVYKHDFGGNRVRFGYFSDPHMGQKEFSEELWDRMCKVFKKESVEVVYSPGDIVEGMSGRPGHIYELAHIGFTAQVSYAASLIGSAPFEVFSILGNHDLWFKDKSDIGASVGEALDIRCKNYHHLGEWEADINLGKGVKMKIYHANDGTAYATSYKLQKLIESFSGGEKPNIVLSGHYHKALYMFNRNVHGFECGTLCGQTRWMRGKKIPAHMGFGIIDLDIGKTGITRLKHEFFPYYQD